jgi:hypothetical protein
MVTNPCEKTRTAPRILIVSASPAFGRVLGCDKKSRTPVGFAPQSESDDPALLHGEAHEKARAKAGFFLNQN